MKRNWSGWTIEKASESFRSFRIERFIAKYVINRKRRENFYLNAFLRQTELTDYWQQSIIHTVLSVCWFYILRSSVQFEFFEWSWNLISFLWTTYFQNGVCCLPTKLAKRWTTGCHTLWTRISQTMSSWPAHQVSFPSYQYKCYFININL